MWYHQSTQVLPQVSSKFTILRVPTGAHCQWEAYASRCSTWWQCTLPLYGGWLMTIITLFAAALKHLRLSYFKYVIFISSTIWHIANMSSKVSCSTWVNISSFMAWVIWVEWISLCVTMKSTIVFRLWLAAVNHYLIPLCKMKLLYSRMGIINYYLHKKGKVVLWSVMDSWRALHVWRNCLMLVLYIMQLRGEWAVESNSI